MQPQSPKGHVSSRVTLTAEPEVNRKWFGGLFMLRKPFITQGSNPGMKWRSYYANECREVRQLDGQFSMGVTMIIYPWSSHRLTKVEVESLKWAFGK